MTKLAVVGVVIGIAVAVTLLFATSGSTTHPKKVETDRENAAISVGRCDAAMSTFSAEITAALEDPMTLRAKVSQVLSTREDVCNKAAIYVRDARQARPDAQLDVAIQRMDAHVARLKNVSTAFAAYEVALGSAMLARDGSAADIMASGAGSAELAALAEAAR